MFLIAVPLWAWSNIEKVDIEPKGERPAEQPGSNYLLVGSDSRKGLTKEEAKRLGTGSADVGNRTDTIMLLHTGDGPNLLLSIPRDSIVNIPGQGTNKINAAFAIGGPKLLVKTIEQNTGLRVDHYVEIGFGGFANMVDAVGGIEICPKQRMVDKLANLRVKKGCQEADGATALGYARSRHVSQYGDIDRARHQREVVSAIGAEVKSPWTFINPIRYFRREQGGHLVADDQQGDRTDRAGHLRSGDDPGQRRERPDLRDADRRPGDPLGPPACAGAAGLHQGRQHRGHPQAALHRDRSSRSEGLMRDERRLRDPELGRR